MILLLLWMVVFYTPPLLSFVLFVIACVSPKERRRPIFIASAILALVSAALTAFAFGFYYLFPR